MTEENLVNTVSCNIQECFKKGSRTFSVKHGPLHFNFVEAVTSAATILDMMLKLVLLLQETVGEISRRKAFPFSRDLLLSVRSPAVRMLQKRCVPWPRPQQDRLVTNLNAVMTFQSCCGEAVQNT